ncbi:hypothetical protein [Oryzibacter oryziterrae]|uniref:hypothetical protein n=1 Tax=Oryzibacter oryziterrae TaxID=2766474 RepID=UPI001F2708A7|nr:hypothetical protein [Oryzibacter oryziterrae]
MLGCLAAHGQEVGSLAGLDAVLAGAVTDPGDTVGAVKRYKLSSSTGNRQLRLLLAAAIDKLASAHKDPEQMVVGQGQILKSSFDAIGNEIAFASGSGAAGSLQKVADALWSTYVAPLAVDAEEAGLYPFAQADRRLVHRWFNVEGSKVSAFELVIADSKTRRLDWVITPLSRHSPKSDSLLRSFVAGAATSERPKLVAYFELSGFSREDIASVIKLADADPGQLQVKIQNTQADIAECIASALADKKAGAKMSASPVSTPAPAPDEDKLTVLELRGAVTDHPLPPAKPGVTIDWGAVKEALSKECTAKHPPLTGEVDIAVLLDPQRQAEVQSVALTSRTDLAAFVRLSRGLVKDWP